MEEEKEPSVTGGQQQSSTEKLASTEDEENASKVSCDQITKSVGDILENMQKNIIKSFQEVKLETQHIIEKQCHRCWRIMQAELAKMKREFEEKETDWLVDRQLLRSRIEALEWKTDQGKNEKMIRSWIGEEMKKTIDKGKTQHPTRREKYSNVLQTHIVIVGQVRICRFSLNFDIASRKRLHLTKNI